ncbi:MAG: hypothetical protein J2P19_27855, partial [Pseudonocardia sp.]|nr:hypothetical protein [Pseudonocardia sp.]
MRTAAVPITALLAVGTVVLWVVALGGSVWIVVRQPVQAARTAVAVPRFDTPRRVDARPDRPAPRSTLLPGDCADALAGPVDVAALLAAPVGSYTG